MKKIYSLMLMLLAFMGVAAQTMPTISDAPVGGEWAANTTWYYIKCGTGDYLNDANHYPNMAVLVLTDQNVPTTDQGKWCVVGSEATGFRIYNKANGYYLATTNNGTGGWAYGGVTDESESYFTQDLFAFQASEAGLDGDWWCLKDFETTTKNRWLCKNTTQSYYNKQQADKVARYDNDKALKQVESAFTFIPVPTGDIDEKPEVVKTPITDASQLSNDLCYTVVTHERGAWTATANGLDHAGASNPEAYPAHRYAFISNDGGETRYLYNVGYKKFVSKNNELTDHPTDPVYLMYPGMVEGTFVVYFDLSHFINIDGNSNVKFDGWGPGGTNPAGCADGGNSCYITPYDNFDPTDALAAFSIDEASMTALINEAETALTFSGVGYPREFSLARTSLQAAIDSAKVYSTSTLHYGNLEIALNEYGLSTDILMPEDGKAYIITNVQKNGKEYYMRYCGSHMDFCIFLSEAEVFVCHQLDNGKYVFVNDEGKYLIWRGNGTEGTNFIGFMDAYDHEPLSYTDIKVEKMVQGSGVSVEGRHLLGLLTLFAKRNAEAFNYLTINNDGTYAHAGTAFFNDSYSAGFKLTEADFDNTFSLKEAPGLTDINAITTFSANYATVVPNNVTAWYVSPYEQQHSFIISMTKIPEGQAIPANTGVLLTGDAGTYKFVPAGNEEEAYLENNMLVGTGKTSVEVDAAENAYVLGKADDEVAFFPLSASNRTIEKRKAYLVLPDALESVKLSFNFNTTAIDHVETVQPATEAIYDLSGRRVMKTVKGQFYISNGKKFIAK